MTDPVRLMSQQSDADELERALLGSLQDAGPSDRVKAVMWQGLAAQLALATAAGAATTVVSSQAAAASASSVQVGAHALSGVATSVSKALALKVVALVALGSVAVGGGALLLTAHNTQPAVVHTRPRTAPQHSEPVVPEVAPEPVAPSLPIPALAEEPTPTPQPHHAARGRSAQLLAESRLLAAARAELRDGKVQKAKTALARLQAQYPHGVLSQEREILTIELLAAQGQGQAARSRAQRFVHLHPESPHGAALARFLSP